MKFAAEKAVLVGCLGRLQRIVERRNTIPILSNVRLSLAGAKLTVAATDLDLQGSETITVEGQGAGETTISAHLFYDLLRKFPDKASVSFDTEAKDHQATIRSGRSRFSLMTLPAEDFPDISVGDISHRFTVPTKDLLRLIRSIDVAISHEETRYYLNGIFLHVAEDAGASVLRTVATDGHRLGRAQIAAPEGAEGMPGVILPRKAVGEIAKLLEASSGDASIQLSATKIVAEIGGVRIVSKLIDGTFPDYMRVIPQGNNRLLKFQRKPVMSAVDRVSTVSTERGRAVALNLSQGKLKLEVSHTDVGSADEELDVDYDADQMKIGFNATYLTQFLDHMAGDDVVAEIGDPGSPALLKDPADPGLLFVLMPMRV